MNQQITAIIIDDEQDARTGLEVLLKTYLPEVEVMVKAENAQQAIHEVVKRKPDIIFLDIKMPGKDGFFVAEEIEKLGIETTIVFITAYDQYAIDAIKHAAFDFILKPVDPDELMKTVTRFKEKKEKESLSSKLVKLQTFLQPQYFKFNTLKGFILLKLDEIIFCAADGNYTELVLTVNRKELVTMQLGKIESVLESKLFVRISRSHLINIQYLKEFNRKKKMVVLNGNEQIELKVSKTGMIKLMDI